MALPDPQLYIIVNGVPTKDKIVRQTLVDVNAVKLAIQKLKEIIWHYKNVDDASLDEAAKNIVEVVDKASSIMHQLMMWLLYSFEGGEVFPMANVHIQE